jgi:hypothetical protein
MSKLMLSYFDNFPEYNGQKIEIRGKDGYNIRVPRWKRGLTT